MFIFLLLCLGVFGWTEVRHGECVQWHHKDYMLNALNEQYTRAADKIDQCERWCLRDDKCKSFALWFADGDEKDGKEAYCSLCATDEMKPRASGKIGGWYWHAIDESERILDCQGGLVQNNHMCTCGTKDCPQGSYCEDGQCFEGCEYGLVTSETCVCDAEKCEHGSFCDNINNQCLAQCPRSNCNNHGQDPDPTDGCESCECDRHFFGDQCQYTDYKSIKEMKLAFCHPVLFGKTNVTRLDTFLDYYRRLGFDRFYFWSEPNDEVERFFAKQDDVTFRIYNEDYELQKHGFFEYPPGYGGGDKDWYHGQNVAIHSCMKLTQQEGFDWVQFGDSDEFVYFTGNEDIRSFLARFHRFSYLSLGKMMYSRSHCAQHEERPNDLFDLLYRPESPFCSFEDNNLYRSYEYCETFFGRRKYIIQPHLVSKLQIHEPVLFEGLGLDLSTDVAHIKELRGYNQYQECSQVLSLPFIEVSDENEFRETMHGAFDTYQVQIRHNTTIVTMIRDDDFNQWLHHLYELPYTQPPVEKLYHEYDHVAAFKEFYERSLEDPCSNDAVLFQYWDVCGFGCATNTLVLQILDAYFRGQTFSFSRQHSDYQRYFRFIFEDKAFPICDEKLDRKPQVEPINPHVFYKTHIHHGRRENALRPLFHHIYHDILWSSLKPVLQDEIETRFSENPQLGEFTAIHVRRGDKCIEEAHCLGFDKYYEHVSHKEQPIFLMTDALMEVATEIEECCSEIQDHIYTLDENLNKEANTRAWDDGSSFIDLIVEISMAGRAESVVCSGSSNLCRLLWALTDTETEIFNMDTKSMLCGDARDVACMASTERQTTYSGHQFKHWLDSLPENLSKFASDLEMMSSVETIDDKLLDSIGIEDDSSRSQLKEAFEKELKLNKIDDHIEVILDTPGSHIRRNLQNNQNSVTTTPPQSPPTAMPTNTQPASCISIAPLLICTYCRGGSCIMNKYNLDLDSCAAQAWEEGQSFFSWKPHNRCRVPHDDKCFDERLDHNSLSTYQAKCITEAPSMSPTPKTWPPTVFPSENPTFNSPSSHPLSSLPSKMPSTTLPSNAPSTLSPSVSLPSFNPTQNPSSDLPSEFPTISEPTIHPVTSLPSFPPSNSLPSFNPTKLPTHSEPSITPTDSRPSISPSAQPSQPPTTVPSVSIPSGNPSTLPPSYSDPTITPTNSPTPFPSSAKPSQLPTSSMPSGNPSTLPPSASLPSLNPSKYPSTKTPTYSDPTITPTHSPTPFPSSANPSQLPTTAPSNSMPSGNPSTLSPSASLPSFNPSKYPSTKTPTYSDPTITPTNSPTPFPSSAKPSQLPTTVPISIPTESPNTPSLSPSTNSPTHSEPTISPSNHPTSFPSIPPSISNPSTIPTYAPSSSFPTNSPSFTPPTKNPSNYPSKIPSSALPTTSPNIHPTSESPSSGPSIKPTQSPTQNPSSNFPSVIPSNIPTQYPTALPSLPPSHSPSVSPSLSPTQCIRQIIPICENCICKFNSNSFYSYTLNLNQCSHQAESHGMRYFSHSNQGCRIPTNEVVQCLDEFLHESGWTIYFVKLCKTQSPSISLPSNSPSSNVPSSTPQFDPPSINPSRYPSTSTHPTLKPSPEIPTISPTQQTQPPQTCDDDRLCYNNGDAYYDSSAGACACTCYSGYLGTNCAYKMTLSHTYTFDNTLEQFNANKDAIASLVADRLAILNSRTLDETPVCEWTVIETTSSTTIALLNCGFTSESEFTADDSSIRDDPDAYESETIQAIQDDFSGIVVTDIELFNYCNPIDNCSSNGLTSDDNPTDGCTCVCDTGFGGSDCSTNILCEYTDCNNAGSTVDTDNTDGCECSCYPGYFGDNCENASSCVRSSNQIGYSSLSTSSSSTISGTDLSLVISVPIDLDVEFIEFHNAQDTAYDYPGASSMWTVTEPTDTEDCLREYTWSGSIVDLLAKFDTSILRKTATSITFDISVEGTTVVPLSDGSSYERSSATIVPVQVNLASNAVVDLSVNTLTDAAPITAVVTMYEVTDTYLIRMTISLYSLHPYSISNRVDLDGSTLPSSYSYGDVSMTGDSVTCVENEECSTEFVVTISPSSCAVSQTLLFDFRATNSVDSSVDVSQNEFVIAADFCDTFLGTLDGLSGDITLYDENPTSVSSPVSTSTLYVGGTLYATVSLSSVYANIASMSFSSVSLSNDGNVYSVATSGTDLTYAIVDQQADTATISIVLDDTYVTGSLAGVSSSLSVDLDVTYSTSGRRLLGLEDDSETLTINHKFELVEEVCGKDMKKGDVDVHECQKGVNIRQCHESGWITIVNNCVHVSE